MMLTLIPFFDRNMSVSAYSLFTRKNNFLMNPSLLGSRQFDGSCLCRRAGTDSGAWNHHTLRRKPIFVSLNNISILQQFWKSECKNYKPCTDSPD